MAAAEIGAEAEREEEEGVEEDKEGEGQDGAVTVAAADGGGAPTPQPQQPPLPVDFAAREYHRQREGELGHYTRYLSEDHGETDSPRQQIQAAPTEGTIWTSEFNHRSSLSVGDIQKQLPKPDKLKDVVKYKGPSSERKVMKQAVTNAELEKAVKNGDSDLVAAILRFGAVKRCVNVNAPLWPKRERMLHLAARGDHRDVCIMLLEAKAEIDCDEISDGRHPIHDACSRGSYDCVELLLDRKARIEENNVTMMRPLHWAAAAGHADVVDLLLDRQAKIGPASGNGMQAIHHAAKGGHVEVLRLLCKRGAKVDAEAQGRRPVQFACLGGHLQAAAVLMDFDALGVLDDFGPGGTLVKYKETELEEFLRAVEQLRFLRDEAEELADMGQEGEAGEAFRQVVEGFLGLGLTRSAGAAREDAARTGIALDVGLDD